MLGWLTALALVALGGALLPYDPVADLNGSLPHQPPSLEHWLGTDWLGRDVFSRLLVGAQAFAFPGAAAVLVAGLVGTVLAVAAQPLRVPRDPRAPLSAVRRALAAASSALIGATATVPRLVGVLLGCAAFGFGAWTLALSAGLLYSAEVAEDLRERLRRCADEEFVEALWVDGVPERRVITRHLLLLQCRDILVRHALNAFSFVLLVETSLSYLPNEFGVQEPSPSWGNMLKGAYRTSEAGGAWLGLMVSACIIFTTVALVRISASLWSGSERW